MTTAEIRHQLEIQHQDLQQFLQSHSPEQVQAQRDGKWSVLQNIEHLYKALVQVNKAIKKPSFLLRRAFGKPNRPLRSYEQLVQRYQEKLQKVESTAPLPFAASKAQEIDGLSLWKDYDIEVKKHLKYLTKVKDRKLETTLIPHPLLGRLITRELLYFQHYHTEHHFRAIRKAVD